MLSLASKFANDLERIERQLEAAGVTTPQLHILSEDDAGVKAHRLNNVEAVLRKDVVGDSERGAIVGIIGAALILGAAWTTGIADFIRFRDNLHAGKHVLVVDIGQAQQHILLQIAVEHPKLIPAGEGDAAPGLVYRCVRKIRTNDQGHGLAAPVA